MKKGENGVTCLETQLQGPKSLSLGVAVLRELAGFAMGQLLAILLAQHRSSSLLCFALLRATGLSEEPAWFVLVRQAAGKREKQKNKTKN